MLIAKVTPAAVLFVFIVEVVSGVPVEKTVVPFLLDDYIKDYIKFRARRSPQYGTPVIVGNNNQVSTYEGDAGGNFMKVTDWPLHHPLAGYDGPLYHSTTQLGGVLNFDRYGEIERPRSKTLLTVNTDNLQAYHVQTYSENGFPSRGSGNNQWRNVPVNTNKRYNINTNPQNREFSKPQIVLTSNSRSHNADRLNPENRPSSYLEPLAKPHSRDNIEPYPRQSYFPEPVSRSRQYR